MAEERVMYRQTSVLSVSEPSDILRQLAARGRQIRASMMENTESRKSVSERVAGGVDVLDFFFDLSGYKRRARRVGKVLARDSMVRRQKELEEEYDNWVQEVRKNLGKMSQVKSSLTRRGNSAYLAKRFRKSQQYVKPTTRLAHGVMFLEDLSERRVVWNDDIPEVLPKPKRRKKRVAYEKRTGKLIGPAGVDNELLVSLLSGHPSELEAIQGAIAVFNAGTPDSGRQALNSCRNAVENLVKRLSGETNWAIGLAKLVPSETRRKTIRQVYSYLSAYGTHGIANPSKTDVELGIRMTVAAVQSILEWTASPT
jgi:hypothetical protein